MSPAMRLLVFAAGFAIGAVGGVAILIAFAPR